MKVKTKSKTKMKTRYTQKELDEMHQLRRQGATFKDIAAMFNRTERAIQVKFWELGWVNERKPTETSQESKPVAEARKPTLDDFLPRDMIKHLYNLGYRIKNNKLIHVHEQVIDIKKILED